jgi:hypothetical protein
MLIRFWLCCQEKGLLYEELALKKVPFERKKAIFLRFQGVACYALG